MSTTTSTTRTRRSSRLLLAVAASAAMAAPTAGIAAASSVSPTGAAPAGSAAQPELPSINAGWTAAAFMPKGAPGWRGQTLYLVSPSGDKHDMGRIGRTEQIEAVSTDGRYVATTRLVDPDSQRVRVALRDLERGTVRTTELPEVSDVDLVDGVGSRVIITRGYEATRVESYDRELQDVRLLSAPWQGQVKDVATEQAGSTVAMMSDGRLRVVDASTGTTQRVVPPPKGYGFCDLNRLQDTGHGKGELAIMSCRPTSGEGSSQVFSVATTLTGIPTEQLTEGNPPAGFGWANFWDRGRAGDGVAVERLECGAEDVHRVTGTGVKHVNTGYPAGGFRTLDVVDDHVIGLGGDADCAAGATALVSHDLASGTNRTLLSGGTVGSAVVMPFSR